MVHGGNTFDSYDDYLEDLKVKEINWNRLVGLDWKDALEQHLGDGFEVIRPKMPNAQNAKYLEWRIWFMKVLPFLKDGVLLVGHSLGGIFLAKYLNEEKIALNVQGTWLIAPPFQVGANESLADFTLGDSLERLAAQGGQITFYHSQDDPVVPFANLNEYQKRLPNAKVRIFNDRLHFNQPELPEIVEEIREAAR